MSVVAIIPARIGSTRLPEKPLQMIGSKTLIQWVYERTASCRYVSETIVATDNEKILDAVESFGGRAEMTSPSHPSGTDRVAEVARKLSADIVLNVQGDEPFMDAEVLGAVLRPMLKDQTIELGTAKTPVTSVKEFFNPAVVKVIADDDDFAIYFSRAPIPFFRDEFAQYGSAKRPELLLTAEELAGCFKHIGVYAYRWDALMRITKLKPTFREQAERLEQLRALDNGIRIKAPTVAYEGFGIDTPDDLERARRHLKG